jgi:hypothetical protein
VISNAHLNFGYPWWISYGHLPIVAAAGLLLLIGYMRKWSIWPMLILAVLVLWSSAAFVVARFVLDINGELHCRHKIFCVRVWDKSWI